MHRLPLIAGYAVYAALACQVEVSPQSIPFSTVGTEISFQFYVPGFISGYTLSPQRCANNAIRNVDIVSCTFLTEYSDLGKNIEVHAEINVNCNSVKRQAEMLTATGTAYYNAACGNDYVDEGEECDDGNANNDDACSNNCTLPVVGTIVGECSGEGSCLANVTTWPCFGDSICYNFGLGSDKNALSNFLFNLEDCATGGEIFVEELSDCQCNHSFGRFINASQDCHGEAGCVHVPCLPEPLTGVHEILKINADDCYNIFTNQSCKSYESVFRVRIEGYTRTPNGTIAYKSGNVDKFGGCCACTGWSFQCSNATASQSSTASSALPETSEASTAQPSSEPESSAPEPSSAEPSSEPETSQPETSTPPESSQSEPSSEPETSQPESSEPEPSSEPETSQPEPSSEPETSQPEPSSEPETSQPESSEPETSQPEPSSEPETSQPESSEPEPSSAEQSSEPESSQPEQSSEPESSQPEPSSEPEESTAPETSQPGESSEQTETPEPPTSQPTTAPAPTSLPASSAAVPTSGKLEILEMF